MCRSRSLVELRLLFMSHMMVPTHHTAAQPAVFGQRPTEFFPMCNNTDYGLCCCRSYVTMLLAPLVLQ